MFGAHASGLLPYCDLRSEIAFGGEMSRLRKVPLCGGVKPVVPLPYVVLDIDSGGVIMRVVRASGRWRGGEGYIAPCTEPTALGKVDGGVIDRIPRAPFSTSFEESRFSADADWLMTPCTPGGGTMSRRVKPLSAILPVRLSVILSEATIEGWPGGGVRGRRPTEPVAHDPARGLTPLVMTAEVSAW